MVKKVKVLGVIPARGGKQSLPGKNILPLLGVPVIAYAILAAHESSLIDKLVVSTEEEKIATVARRFGAKVIYRPKELALDTSPIEDSLRHAVKEFEKQKFFADIVIQMQANVPIRKFGIIDQIIIKLIDSDADSVATIFQIDQYPQWAKKIDAQGYLKPFLPLSSEYRRQKLEKTYLIDGAVIATKKNVLMSSEGIQSLHSYMGTKILGVIQEKIFAMEIDTSEDFLIAESLLKMKQNCEDN